MNRLSADISGLFSPSDLRPRSHTGFLAGAVCLLAMALGYYVSLDPGWLRVWIDLTRASHWLGVLIGAGVFLVILRWPGVGLLLLVATIYTNISEIGVRHYQWPSLLQLVMPLLALAILGRQLVSSRPRLVVDALLALLILYTVVIFASSVRAVNPELADERLFDHLKSLAIVLVVINLMTSRLDLRHVTWVLVLVGAFLSTISMYQVATSAYTQEFGGLGRIKVAHIVDRVRQPRIAGPVGDPNFYAQILVPLVPLAFYQLWKEPSLRLKLIAAYSLSMISLALVFTYSRGGILALAVVVLLAVIMKKIKPRHLVLGFILFLPLWLVVPREFEGRLSTLKQLIPGADETSMDVDTSFRERVLLMQVAWEMFRDHPVLGVGAGNYSEHYEDYAQRIGSTVSSYEDFGQRRFPHSLYLEIAAETGLVGLLLFAGIVVVTFLRARSAIRLFTKAGDIHSAHIVTALALGLVGYLTSSVFLHGHYLRYFWLLVALMVAARRIGSAERMDKPLSFSG
ncbi:MAG TPA: O-antigen ligase family protein [Blastocatellia bacterium]|nr:O-antigen ligase family protein [Blastocatellia bacterium]